MKTRGWVYVITNPSMPNLVKVGFSLKDPIFRAFELNNTGTPLSFKVEYDALVTEPRDIEQLAHVALACKRTGKEWFSCEVDYAITVIRRVAGINLIVEKHHINNEITQASLQSCTQADYSLVAEQIGTPSSSFELKLNNGLVVGYRAGSAYFASPHAIRIAHDRTAASSPAKPSSLR